MRQANKDGYLERKENNNYKGLINLSILLCTNRKKKKKIHCDKWDSSLEKNWSFPSKSQCPSCSVLPMGFCFRLIVYVAIHFYWPWRCPKEIALILIHFDFLANSKGLGIWPVYLPRRRKVNITEKKIYRGAPLFIHRKKKKVTPSLLTTLLAIIKCRVKAPEGRMGWVGSQ